MQNIIRNCLNYVISLQQLQGSAGALKSIIQDYEK